MKENKSTLITAVVLILLFGGILFIFNKQGYLSFKGKETTVINTVDNTTLDKNTVNNNYIDVSKLSEFKNYDGTYGIIDMLELVPEDNPYYHIFYLRLDGTVSFNNTGYEKSQKINISDVVQIDSVTPNKCYLLDKNNQVYLYEGSDSFTVINHDVSKVNEASNVVRLVRINYCPTENAGCASTLIGIKTDGSYVTLDSFRR